MYPVVLVQPEEDLDLQWEMLSACNVIQLQHEFMHIFKQVLDYLLYIIYYTFNKNVSSTFFPDRPGILVLELFFFC